MNKQKSILVVGAGLCGSLLALRLGQRGYNVRVVESRPDLRRTNINSGRSINLALSDRGIKAMRLVGVQDKVRSLCIPMNGRMIHESGGNTFFSPYSGRTDEFINSISRGQLTALLIDEAEALGNVVFEFDKKCKEVDIETRTAIFRDKKTARETEINAHVIFGTDGAGSAVRKSYFLSKRFLFSYSQNYLSHGYKELSILPTKKGEFRAQKNALHIWPRGNFMLIALPNLDGSFTVTLFLSYDEGPYNFKNLTNPEIVTEFFEKEFPDALELMPNLVDDFFNNPTAPLGTVKCSPWHYKGNTLLLGDAAHAIVPFYGQGMNASFEDVVEFDKFLDTHQGDWETTFKTFEKSRKKDTDAIADLALDNFVEMRDHVANPIFQKKRQLETLLETHFPDEYLSKYSLVTFNENLGYHEAMTRGRAQDKAILNMIADRNLNTDPNMSKTELKKVLDRVLKETETIIEEDRLAQTMHY
jgi:kynurenine 3-monooxygenase